MSEEIPAWAFERARMLCDSECEAPFTGNAFARYIMKHEQPPVDPEFHAMDAAIVAYNEAYSISGVTHTRCVQAAIEAFRKHKEAGK